MGPMGVCKLQDKYLANLFIIGDIEEEVALSKDLWLRINFNPILKLLDLFLVSDLGNPSLILIAKWPSDSIKPVNQLLSSIF